LGRLSREILASKILLLPETAAMFVNLHPAEIEDPMLLGETDPLRPHASRIVFEVTERASILDFDYFRKRLTELKLLGYRFAVDDLGAGYASLSSVALLEPDFLKIDMSITRDLKRDTPRYGLLKRIVEFANDHSLRVIAEGIETTDQADAAREIGSHFLQGYLMGRPARVSAPE
jgi:EAL domain-containing protein (putative c-di-GMP-specific phosphodiesterase class I)